VDLSFLKEVDWGSLGAILLAGFAGAAFTLILQHLYSSHSYSQQQKFVIYGLLLDLHNAHFWIASAEVTGEKSAGREAIDWFNKTRLKIADEARKLKRFPEAERILSALYSLDYSTERDRAKDIRTIIDEMGKIFHPDVRKAMSKIAIENDILLKRDPELYTERMGKLLP